MKIAMFGVGGIGRTICHLLKNKLDHLDIEIIAFDISLGCPAGVEVDEYHYFDADPSYSTNKRSPLQDRGFDVVFSALPYFCNTAVANLATAADIPYFDLGGSVPVSKEINKQAEDRKATVFTDLGLAPGWVNIMAEKAFLDLSHVDSEVTTIKMRCGGLPLDRYMPCEDPFGYTGTWSSEGLYNEYIDDCQVLEYGKIITEPGMLGLEEVSVGGTLGHIPLEAFYTSGGASHTIELMKERGVRNCSYKTLRYPGHRDLIYYFTKIKNYTAKQLSELFTPHPEGDIIVLDVWAQGEGLVYHRTHEIHCDPNGTGYSAMQKATASGFIAAALSSNRGQRRPLTYADVDICQFDQVMDKLEVLK